MIGADEIEISFDAKAEVGIAFKVNRATWMAATDEEKHKLIAAVVEAAAHHFNRDIVPFTGGFASINLLGPDLGELNLLKEVDVYDPNEGEDPCLKSASPSP